MGPGSACPAAVTPQMSQPALSALLAISSRHSLLKLLLDPNLVGSQLPFSVGEEGYRDWRLDASSNSKDFLWMTEYESFCLQNHTPTALEGNGQEQQPRLEVLLTKPAIRQASKMDPNLPSK